MPRYPHPPSPLNAQRGYDVLGGYLSPVHEGYGKPGLASAEQRCAMAEAAAATSPLVMVDRCAPHPMP